MSISMINSYIEGQNKERLSSNYSMKLI